MAHGADVARPKTNPGRSIDVPRSCYFGKGTLPSHVPLARHIPIIRKAKAMNCQFCQQDVKDPCHDTEEMRQRAMSHVDRCEKALKEDLSDGINSSDGQSAGSI